MQNKYKIGFEFGQVKINKIKFLGLFQTCVKYTYVAKEISTRYKPQKLRKKM